MLVYSFRTFPELGQLPNDTFVFSKLKEDIETLKQRLLNERPGYVVGIAVSKSSSRVEPIAINQFNKGKVTKNGVYKLDLFVPEDAPFKPSSSPTHIFCNWTMYKLQEAIKASESRAKLVFFHVNPKDLDKLTAYLATLA